jgi:hypothetical protein
LSSRKWEEVKGTREIKFSANIFGLRSDFIRVLQHSQWCSTFFPTRHTFWIKKLAAHQIFLSSGIIVCHSAAALRFATVPRHSGLPQCCSTQVYHSAAAHRFDILPQHTGLPQCRGTKVEHPCQSMYFYRERHSRS